MSDKIKSALELALERASKIEEGAGSSRASLTDEEKEEIAEIKRKYQAKIAEKEVMLDSKLQEVISSMPPQQAQMEIARLREGLSKERRALEQERDRKIEAIHRKKRG